mgnify:CR=1 FL=1
MESHRPVVGYIRIHPRASAPERATRGASGFDLRACLDAPVVVNPGAVGLIATGLALAIPSGYEGQVRARSGLALKHGMFVINGPGTIDADYRGPLGVILANFGREPFTVAHGDRIAQIVFARVPEVTLQLLDALPPTDRGDGGFGHTGIE